METAEDLGQTAGLCLEHVSSSFNMFMIFSTIWFGGVSACSYFSLHKKQRRHNLWTTYQQLTDLGGVSALADSSMKVFKR